MAALSLHKKLMNAYVIFKKHLIKQNILLQYEEQLFFGNQGCKFCAKFYKYTL